MGGKVIQSVFGLPEKRLSKEEYFSLAARLSEKMKDYYHKRFYILQNYKNKESFGDLDMILETDPHFPYKTWIKDTFGIEPSQNTSVYSFPFEDFQVDFILTKPEDWEPTKFYYYGETGNCEGRLFHKKGLRWGHDGLSYFIRNELFDPSQKGSSHIAKIVNLSRDPKEAMEIGGFDYDWRVNGFENQEELFNYIITSKYFDPEIFKFENLNHINRTRNRKRPVYAALVDYIEKNKSQGNYVFKDKSIYLEEWKVRWPHLGEEIEKAREEFFKAKELKSKFNGHLVKKWLGMDDGKLVGKVVTYIKERFNVEAHTEEQLKNAVLNYVRNL